MTLADKLREARKNAGLTQAELADKLCVSRQAITKWETGKGLPDIDNLRGIAQLLHVSMDVLVDDAQQLEARAIREKINLEDYVKEGRLRSRQEAAVYAKYPDARITPLLFQKKSSKLEKLFGELVGWLTDAPFGLDGLFHRFEDAKRACFLVEQGENQTLVTVTQEFMEARRMTPWVDAEKFTLEDYEYRKCAYNVEK